MGALHSVAFCSKTGRVSCMASPITTGICCFMIPAFSPAIRASVLPRNCMWSKLMLVISDNIGVIMFVQSRRPPSPTSMTATSTCCSLKYKKASAVVNSKNDGWRVSEKLCSCFTNSITRCLGIGIPFTRIRSLKSTKCGEVYNPTLYPAS